MKDVLSFLVGQNSLARDQSTPSGVLEVWLPLVQKLAATSGKTAAEQLSSILFRAMNDASEVIYRNGIHKKEIAKVKASKCGKLDNLPDNCLSHCLSFLNHSDVLLNVERSCRRLLHVSRTRKKPFRLRFDSIRVLISARSKYSGKQALAAARRVLTHSLDSERFRSKNAVPFAKIFKDDLAVLRCETRSKALCFRYPNLQQLLLFGSNNGVFIEFLRRHPNVHKCAFTHHLRQRTARFYAALAVLKQLTHVAIRSHDPKFEAHDRGEIEMKTMDFSHIRHLKMFAFDSWSLFRPFLHNRLSHLTLQPTTISAPVFDILLPNAQTLTLDFIHRRHIARNTLDRIVAPKLTELRVRCGFDAISRSLHLCPNGRVYISIVEVSNPRTNAHLEEAQRREMREGIEELRRNCGLFAPQSLELNLEFHSFDENLCQFVFEIVQMLAPRTCISIGNCSKGTPHGNVFRFKHHFCQYLGSALLDPRIRLKPMRRDASVFVRHGCYPRQMLL